MILFQLDLFAEFFVVINSKMSLPNGIDNESGFIEVEIKLYRHKLVKEMKQMIYIVPDSNFLHISYDKSRTTSYSQFYLNQPFEELIN